DSRVLIDLEGNAVYPETLTEAFWRGYAALLRCRASSIAALIASYDRDKIGVSGMRAARSGPSMSAERRASFLVESDGEVRVVLAIRVEEGREGQVVVTEQQVPQLVADRVSLTHLGVLGTEANFAQRRLPLPVGAVGPAVHGHQRDREVGRERSD